MKTFRNAVWRAVFVLFMVLSGADQGFAQTPYITSLENVRAVQGSVLGIQLNGGNFGQSKSDETLAFMAQTLRAADFIVIEEVSTHDVGPLAALQLAHKLGPSWACVVSHQTTGAGTERFAVLYNTNRLSAVKDEMRLIQAYEDTIDREPGIVTFIERRSGKRFDVVAFHLQPDEGGKKKKSGRQPKDPRTEIAAIAANPGPLIAGPMIMVGDFNLSHEELDPVFERVLGMRHYVDVKTTLKTKHDGKGNYLQKPFDNVYARQITVYQVAVLDLVQRLAGDLEAARFVSDHLPVAFWFTL